MHEETGNKKRATCFVTLPQNQLDGDVERFSTHEKTSLQAHLLEDRFVRGC